MSHAENKIEWCIKKAERELKETGKHRGLIKTNYTKEQILEHISKAEHNFKAAVNLKENGFSDWSASAFFYSIYQCLLAISTKFGYESGNQECTFALIESLIENKQIEFDRELLEKIAKFDSQNEKKEQTIIDVREKMQYGTDLSIKDDLYNEMKSLAESILDKTKEIIEK